MAPADHAATLLRGHHPVSTRGLGQARCVLGNRLTPTGLVYWQVEATRTTDGSCSFIFGVMSSVFLGDEYPGAGISSWGVDIECNSATTTLRMQHAAKRLHEVVCETICRQDTHRCGLLLDVDNRSLSVIDGETSQNIFTFQNIDTSKGVTPIYGVYPGSYYGTLRLINPEEIKNSTLLPFPVVHRDVI